MPLNSNFDPIPDADLDMATANLESFIDIMQKYPGVLPDKVVNLLIAIETDLCTALVDRGMVEVYEDLADVPVIENERDTDTMPAVPVDLDLEPEWSPDDTQQTTAFDAFIEGDLFDEEDYL